MRVRVAGGVFRIMASVHMSVNIQVYGVQTDLVMRKIIVQVLASFHPS